MTAPPPLASRVFELLFGKVVHVNKLGYKKIPCVQVTCPLNDYNEVHKNFFAKPKDFWATDERAISKVGDSVLIRLVEERSRPTPSVDYKVERVITEHGNLVDPLTRKPIFMDEFKDEIELKKKVVADFVSRRRLKREATSPSEQRDTGAEEKDVSSNSA